jgi:predicted ATPase
MLTRLRIRNFKRFDDVTVELGNPAVLVGPNNSGKTTVLQAIALWNLAVAHWSEKREGASKAHERTGVVINRKDLFTMPVPDARQLWNELHVRSTVKGNVAKKTQNVRIEIVVDGLGTEGAWRCGFELDYANEESFYGRPVKVSGAGAPRMGVPREASSLKVTFLPPMSGLADREFKKQHGELQFLIGQGRTAEVLRNLCLLVHESTEGPKLWTELASRAGKLFGVTLDPPEYIEERSEIRMTYQNASRTRLDLSTSGRGFQQTLLLFAYLALNPGSIVLLDEPDAHLEVVRQRQIYEELSMWTRRSGSQVIIASHSEVLLQEAAGRDVVVAFLGKPHRIDMREMGHVARALTTVGFDQYFQAEQKGWLLYVSAPSDLAAIRAFARKTGHHAETLLEQPFVFYVGDRPERAWDHFLTLQQAHPRLRALLIAGRETAVNGIPPSGMEICQLSRRKFENYFATLETVQRLAESLARDESEGSLFESGHKETHRLAMQRAIEERVPRRYAIDPEHSWWQEMRAVEDFLDPVFDEFFMQLNRPNEFRLRNYNALIDCMRPEAVADEIGKVLDRIVELAKRAAPAVAERSGGAA